MSTPTFDSLGLVGNLRVCSVSGTTSFSTSVIILQLLKGALTFPRGTWAGVAPWRACRCSRCILPGQLLCALLLWSAEAAVLSRDARLTISSCPQSFPLPNPAHILIAFHPRQMKCSGSRNEISFQAKGEKVMALNRAGKSLFPPGFCQQPTKSRPFPRDPQLTIAAPTQFALQRGLNY